MRLHERTLRKLCTGKGRDRWNRYHCLERDKVWLEVLFENHDGALVPDLCRIQDKSKH